MSDIPYLAADRHRITQLQPLFRCARQLTAISVRSLTPPAAPLVVELLPPPPRARPEVVITARDWQRGKRGDVPVDVAVRARELAPAEPRAAFHATAPSNCTLHASWPVEGARLPAERRWLRELSVALRRADTGALVWERHVRFASLVPLSTELATPSVPFPPDTLLFHFEDGLFCAPAALRPLCDARLLARAPPPLPPGAAEARSLADLEAWAERALGLVNLLSSANDDAAAERARLDDALRARAARLARAQRRAAHDREVDALKAEAAHADATRKQLQADVDGLGGALAAGAAAIRELDAEIAARGGAAARREAAAAAAAARADGPAAASSGGGDDLAWKVNWRRQRMGAQLAEVFPVRVLAADDGTPPSPHGGAPVASAGAAAAGAGAVAICGLRLPPDERGAASDRWAGGDRWAEEEAAALGAAAQFVVLAARFLRVRLRFGVRIGASRSWVVDAADAERGVGGAKGAAAKGTARGEWPLFSGGARGLGSGQPVAACQHGAALLARDVHQLLGAVLGADAPPAPLPLGAALLRLSQRLIQEDVPLPTDDELAAAAEVWSRGLSGGRPAKAAEYSM